MQNLAHGYKGKTCIDKNCLACSAVAPKVNKKIVKNLYDKFGMSVGYAASSDKPTNSSDHDNDKDRKNKKDKKSKTKKP